VRIEKILATILYEAHERQVEEAMYRYPRNRKDCTGKGFLSAAPIRGSCGEKEP
jgi:hypothetical protein